MIKRTTHPEVARLVDDAFDLDNVDSDARFVINEFTRRGGVPVKNSVKEHRASAWNVLVKGLKKRQKTVKETGRLVKGERNRLCDMLEGASYDWPEAESGLLIPVVDILITGYRATRKIDVGSYYSRTTPVNGEYAEIKGVECEVLAVPDPNYPKQLIDLGLGVVRTCVEDPMIFKGDEDHIFIPADRLLTIATQSRGRNSITGYQ